MSVYVTPGTPTIWSEKNALVILQLITVPVYGGVAVANAPNGADSSYLYIPASEPFFSELKEDNLNLLPYYLIPIT